MLLSPNPPGASRTFYSAITPKTSELQPHEPHAFRTSMFGLTQASDTLQLTEFSKFPYGSDLVLPLNPITVYPPLVNTASCPLLATHLLSFSKGGDHSMPPAS